MKTSQPTLLKSWYMPIIINIVLVDINLFAYSGWRYDTNTT